MFKKTVIMHWKAKFSKIKGSICNIPTEATNIWNISPRPTVSKGLIVVKLKRDLKHRGHVYFEPVCLHMAYRALNHLKYYNIFWWYICRVSQVRTCLHFGILLKFKDNLRELLKKNVSHEKEMTENINGRSKTAFASVKIT